MEEQSRRLPLRVEARRGSVKRSLILAGGGMRLAYQTGVIKALEEEGLQFNHADGTSGGIFNLAMLLSGLTTEEMCDNWRTVSIKDFVSYLPLRKYLNPFKLPAFGDADGIIRKVFPHLGIDIERIKAEHTIAGTFNVCNYSYKINEAIPNHDITLEHLIAGVSLPIFMPAVKINSDWYIDAVWIKDANLMEAVKRGAEEIWLIWAIGNQHEYKQGSFNQYVHMIEMSANGALFAEFDYINELNSRIVKGDSPYGQKEPIKVHIIKPQYPLPLDTDLYFNRINTSTLIEMGYADAKEYISVKDTNPAPLSPSSTKMEPQGIAFSCRAKLKGKLWQKDSLLHISLSIHDIDRFIEEQQAYRLEGSLHFAADHHIYYGYDGRLDVQVNSEARANISQFSFRIRIEGEELYLTGRWSSGNVLYASKTKTGKVEVKLYKEKSMEGQPAASSLFTTSVADWLYLQKSFSFYNTRNWFEKRKAKRKLQSHFFSKN